MEEGVGPIRVDDEGDDAERGQAVVILGEGIQGRSKVYKGAGAGEVKEVVDGILIDGWW